MKLGPALMALHGGAFVVTMLLLLWREQGARVGAPRSGVIPAPPENPAYAETVFTAPPAGMVIAPTSMSSSTPGMPT